MAEMGEDDYVFFGRPIEREEDTSNRKRKAIADAGSLRALPPWKQEVRDEEGRKRFHGAFTGGYSAGFYNTVGSKEGWTPQTFTSSRKNRAETKKQSVYNFFDEDDIKDMGGNAVETSIQYDTFGFTANEYARKQADKDQDKRPSAIPGLVPDEIVLPASSSIGVQLLMKMGWRQGRSIKDSNTDSLSERRREARRAVLALSGTGDKTGEEQMESSLNEAEEIPDASIDALHNSENTPVFVLNPKQDLYGLGFDPFKHAPEFRDSKRLRESKSRERDKSKVMMRGNFLSSSSGKYAPGFGIGALEEHDIEDEDIYAAGFDYEQTEVDLEPTNPFTSKNDHKLRLEDKKRDSLPGFKPASNSDYTLERLNPPKIPRDFTPLHKFAAPLDQTLQNYKNAPPPEVSPPENTDLKTLIDGSAAMIARCGKSVEDLYKEKCKTNPMFSFLLTGSEGHDYYLRKLWENKQKFNDNNGEKIVEKLSAENRGRILGEKPLKSSIGFLNDGGAKNDAVRKVVDLRSKPVNLANVPESAKKPFKHDPLKQERFEQFLKEKYEGGLRSSRSSLDTGTGIRTGISSEGDRARERLNFESAAEVIEKGNWRAEIDALPTKIDEKGKWGTENDAGINVKDLLGFGEDRFVSSNSQIEKEEEKVEAIKEVYPKRERFEWRPAPILCKRFDLIDPFMGKAPPVPRPRSKIDNLIFLTETFKSSNKEDIGTETPIRDSVGTSKTETGTDADITLSPKSVERPLDLYKAIFSDESDDDVADGAPVPKETPDLVKTSEGANKTLNRLVAGDFLESLGKQLGLEVPHENKPGPAFNANTIEEENSNTRDDAAALTKDKHEEYSKDLEPSREREKRHKRRGRSGTPGSGSDLDFGERKRSRLRNHKRRSRTPSSDSDSDLGSRERTRSHSRGHKRSRTPDSNSGSEREKSRKSRSSRRNDSSEERKYKYKYSDDKKEKRKKHHSKRHRRDSREKYYEKKRWS